MLTPSPDDTELAAWLAGDLGDRSDASVAAAVRDDPEVARRADHIAETLSRLAAAATPPAALAGGRELDVVAPGVAGGSPGIARRADVGPRDSRPAGRTRGRGVGPGRRPGAASRTRRDRWLDRVRPGAAVMLVVVVVSTIGVQTFRDGPGLSPGDPGDEPAEVMADGEGRTDDDGRTGEGGTEDEAATSGASGSNEGSAGDLAGGAAVEEVPSEEASSEGQGPVDDGLGSGSTSSVGGPGAADGTGQTPGTGASAAGPGGTEPSSGQQSGEADRPSSQGDPLDEEARQPGAGPEQPAEGGQPPVGDAPQPGEGVGSPEGVDQPAGEDDASADGGDEAPNPVPSPVAPDPVDDDVSSEPPPSSPTVRDSMVGLADEAAVRAWFGGRPETTPLIGLTAAQARERAAVHAEEIRSSPPFASGAHPGACLDAVAGGPTVVAAVESATYAGQPSLAHLVVTGTDTLDTARAIITDPTTCAIRLAIDVPA